MPSKHPSGNFYLDVQAGSYRPRGSFTLTWNGTSTTRLAWDASAEGVQGSIAAQLGSDVVVDRAASLTSPANFNVTFIG